MPLTHRERRRMDFNTTAHSSRAAAFPNSEARWWASIPDVAQWRDAPRSRASVHDRCPPSTNTRLGESNARVVRPRDERGLKFQPPRGSAASIRPNPSRRSSPRSKDPIPHPTRERSQRPRFDRAEATIRIRTTKTLLPSRRCQRNAALTSAQGIWGQTTRRMSRRMFPPRRSWTTEADAPNGFAKPATSPNERDNSGNREHAREAND